MAKSRSIKKHINKKRVSTTKRDSKRVSRKTSSRSSKRVIRKSSRGSVRRRGSRRSIKNMTYKISEMTDNLLIDNDLSVEDVKEKDTFMAFLSVSKNFRVIVLIVLMCALLTGSARNYSQIFPSLKFDKNYIFSSNVFDTLLTKIDNYASGLSEEEKIKVLKSGKSIVSFVNNSMIEDHLIKDVFDWYNDNASNIETYIKDVFEILGNIKKNGTRVISISDDKFEKDFNEIIRHINNNPKFTSDNIKKILVDIFRL